MRPDMVIVFFLLNIAIGGLLAAGMIGIAHHTFADWLSMELAQVLGAMQTILFYTIATTKGKVNDMAGFS